MANEIKKLTFKQKSNLQIEVLPLQSLGKLGQNVFLIPHRTNFYHVFLFEKCKPQHVLDFETISIDPFSLLFIDKNRVHQFDNLQNYKGSLLLFTEDFFCTSELDSNFLHNCFLFSNFNNKPTLALNQIRFNTFSAIFERISEELIMPNDRQKPVIIKNLLHNLLLLAERDKMNIGFSEIKKDIAFEYTNHFRIVLETNFVHLKNVSEYAKILFLSEKRLRQATAKVLGKSPKEIINDRILLEAKRLLVHTHISVKEIGQQLGFDDSSYFVRYFKKIANETPIEFRNKFFK